MELIEYLEDRDIDYQESGKNVSDGWVELNCMFCSDPSYHLGINLESLYGNCWICGGHNIVEIVKEIEDCTWSKAKEIVKQFGERYYNRETTDQPTSNNSQISKVSLPTSTTDFPKTYKRYLKKRRYNPNYLINKYSLRACKDFGKYKYRIIVPFYLNSKLVTFSSIDITGKADIKYLHCPKNESIKFVNQTLYNIDTVKEVAVIVEGIFDVWRIGDGCVGLMTKNYTKEQIKLLLFKKVKKCYIMLDSDAGGKEEQLAYELAQFTEVERLRLDKGDPDDLTDEEAKEIKQLIY